MAYESPIEFIQGAITAKFEDEVMRYVQSYEINVDRDELIKALAYDREQYEKGYADAKAEFEPKHGRWKGAGMGDYMCSLCAEVVSGNRWHYCPNCGAQMASEVENGKID